MVFWAWEERKKMIKAREDMGAAMVIAELMAEGIPRTKEDLERWARDKGLPMDKVLARGKRGRWWSRFGGAF